MPPSTTDNFDIVCYFLLNETHRHERGPKFWNTNTLFLPEVCRMKRADIHTHTKTLIALAHMHHKNTGSRSCRVLASYACRLLCITRPEVNPYHAEAPFIFRALHWWQFCANVTILTKSLNFYVFILNIKRNKMCQRKINNLQFFFHVNIQFRPPHKTILTRFACIYSCLFFQNNHASFQ